MEKENAKANQENKNESGSEDEENNINTKKENKDKDKDEKEELDNIKGYGYWKREGDLIDRDKFIPQKIDSFKETEVPVLENKISLGSAWNTAGTWEEKHYKKNAIEDFFNQKLSNIKINEKLGLKSIKNFSGDVSSILKLI